MPEGPECRRIGEALAKRLSGRTITSIDVLSGRYESKPPSGMQELTVNLPITIVGAGVHGKFLYWILKDEHSVWNTLGMTGTWSNQKSKHSRIKFTLNDSVVFYNDMRNFGTFKFVKGKFELIKKLNSLGPDMLSNPPTDEVFIDIMRKKKEWTLAKALMNQSVVSGVGNYIKADALWLSKLSPNRFIKDCSASELATLNSSIQSVMNESYKSGGATIKSYKNFEGEIGNYSERMLVYGRKTDSHGNEVIKETTQDGRTTHWVPCIQK